MHPHTHKPQLQALPADLATIMATARRAKATVSNISQLENKGMVNLKRQNDDFDRDPKDQH